MKRLAGELKLWCKLHRTFRVNLPIFGENLPYATLRYFFALFIRIEQVEKREQPNTISSQLNELEQGREAL